MDNKESYQLHGACIIQCIGLSVSGFAMTTLNSRLLLHFTSNGVATLYSWLGEYRNRRLLSLCLAYPLVISVANVVELVFSWENFLDMMSVTWVLQVCVYKCDRMFLFTQVPVRLEQSFIQGRML